MPRRFALNNRPRALNLLQADQRDEKKVRLQADCAFCEPGDRVPQNDTYAQKRYTQNATGELKPGLVLLRLQLAYMLPKTVPDLA